MRSQRIRSQRISLNASVSAHQSQRASDVALPGPTLNVLITCGCISHTALRTRTLEHAVPARTRAKTSRARKGISKAARAEEEGPGPQVRRGAHAHERLHRQVRLPRTLGPAAHRRHIGAGRCFQLHGQPPLDVREARLWCQRLHAHDSRGGKFCAKVCYLCLCLFSPLPFAPFWTRARPSASQIRGRLRGPRPRWLSKTARPWKAAKTARPWKASKPARPQKAVAFGCLQR